MPNIKTSKLPIYALFGFLYLLCSVYAMSYFFYNSSLGDKYIGGQMRFEEMVDGTARKPFVYRQLVPIIVRALDQITPDAVREGGNQWVEGLKYRKNYKELQQTMPWFFNTFPDKATHYIRLLGSLIIFGFWVGYMAGIFALARAVMPSTPAVAFIAPLFATVAFSSFGYQWQYIYDIPCLCLSTACFYFLYTGRLRLYFLAFFLACLNKETAIFSVIFFSIWCWDKMDDRKFGLLWGAQCIIYCVVKVSISIYFMANDGSFLEINPGLMLKRDLLAQANIHKVALVAVLWFLFTHHWQDKPEFLKKTLWLLPLFYAAYFFAGFPGEYRVFFDLHAPLILLALHTLVVATGVAASPVFAPLQPDEGSS
ncbi:MAG: hypothetical protein SFX19_00440 [Alphaproteobacteria bacterium]|nr:hypothetical protein [Alphaproteobacteria bacterium]